MDRFRLAQDRTAWRKQVLEAFPLEQVDPHKEAELNAWEVGDPIPLWARPGPDDPLERVHEHSEDELGDRRRAEPGSYGREQRRRRDRREQRGQGTPTCPVCGETFNKFNQLTFRYEADHSICDNTIVTVQAFPCTLCKQTFR